MIDMAIPEDMMWDEYKWRIFEEVVQKISEDYMIKGPNFMKGTEILGKYDFLRLRKDGGGSV